MQNSFHESFNGLVRDGLLNDTLLGLRHAHAKFASWTSGYNSERSYSGLGYLTPVAQAAEIPQDEWWREGLQPDLPS